MRNNLSSLIRQPEVLPAIDRATLNHLHLRVDDLDRAQAFYERHFGWVPAMQIPGAERRMRFLRDRKGFLLVLETHPDRSPMPKWFHIGIELESARDVREAVAYFSREGIEPLVPPIDTSEYVSFTISDPEGYHIQVYWDAWEPSSVEA